MATLWAVLKGSGGQGRPPRAKGPPRPSCGPTVVRPQQALLRHRPAHPPGPPFGSPGTWRRGNWTGCPTCPQQGLACRSAHRRGRRCPHTRSAGPARGAAGSGGPALQPAEPGGVLRDWTVHRARSACKGQRESGPHPDKHSWAQSWPGRRACTRGNQPHGTVTSQASTLSPAPWIWGRPWGEPFTPHFPETTRKGAGPEGMDHVAAPPSGRPQTPGHLAPPVLKPGLEERSEFEFCTQIPDTDVLIHPHAGPSLHP